MNFIKLHEGSETSDGLWIVRIYTELRNEKNSSRPQCSKNQGTLFVSPLTLNKFWAMGDEGRRIKYFIKGGAYGPKLGICTLW